MEKQPEAQSQRGTPQGGAETAPGEPDLPCPLSQQQISTRQAHHPLYCPQPNTRAFFITHVKSVPSPPPLLHCPEACFSPDPCPGWAPCTVLTGQPHPYPSCPFPAEHSESKSEHTTFSLPHGTTAPRMGHPPNPHCLAPFKALP
jgi:hypothetical protein